MIPLLLAGVIAVAGDGVPDGVLEQARDVVAERLAGVEADVTLRLFRTQAEMLAAAPRAPAGSPAYYQYVSRTIFAFLAPRADLAAERLSGVLTGALVHEAAHARGTLSDAGYRRRPLWQIEGEADAEAAAAVPAWRLLMDSRVHRAHRGGLFLPDSEFVAVDPAGLPASQRATWYAQAYARRALPVAKPAWVLWNGFADPRSDGYRLVAAPARNALLVRAAPGPLLVRVTVLPVGKGQIDLLVGFRSRANYSKLAFLKRGGVRFMRRRRGRWTKGPLLPAPPLRPGVAYRIELRGGVVRLDGREVFARRMPRGRCGIGVFDAAADFVISSS